MEPIESELFGIKKKKQSVNSKKKGNRNEVNVAHLFTAWTGHEFKRTPQSGGIGWLDKRLVCGDIVNTNPDFKFVFSVEAKHYKTIGYTDMNGRLRLRSNSRIYGFMKQAAEAAEAAGKYPICIARENGMPKDEYMVFLPVNAGQAAKLHAMFKHVIWGKRVIGVRSGLFFSNISYEQLKTICDGNKD